ncbi:metallophosphoesterase [Methylocapsa sp. S129]|uniref:metallophosphoesterase family protein n=1 Tax=Methylocapsa sp. S129 TaxID=1641869 RepID=UPI00131BE3C1|nr:metallophosphoesterase [Methylocapsa sp. S129]
MAAPAIALRFRDTTPGIDTIAEHRELIARDGRVGWGWWKKTFEPAETKKIHALLDDDREIGIILIDRTAERAYLCACVGFAEPNAAEAKIVPPYYRDHLDETAGVFILRTIEDLDYDEALADAIREQTFLWIGAVADPVLGHVATAAQAPGRSCVLHLSDLHFGKDYGFRLQGEDVAIGDGRHTLTECIVADLERLGLTNDIAAIIVTGDFMTHGDWAGAPRRAALAEFETLRKRLELQKNQIIAVPGNHDVVRYSDPAKIDVRENAVEKQANYEHETMFRTFVDELVGRDWKASLNYIRRIHLGEADLDVCVLNSCTIAATEWTEYGYVGRNGLDAIAELAKQKVERPTFRFLALHHHLLPVANVEAPKSRGVTLTLDASDILAAAQRGGVNVALHGHQHKPKIAMYQSLPLNGEVAGTPIHVVANGSAGAKNDRLPPGERNTYCLFRLRANAIDLWIRELRLDAVAGAQVFHGALPVAPIAV